MISLTIVQTSDSNRRLNSRSASQNRDASLRGGLTAQFYDVRECPFRVLVHMRFAGRLKCLRFPIPS